MFSSFSVSSVFFIFFLKRSGKTFAYICIKLCMGDSLVAQLVKNLPASVRPGLIPESGRSPGEGIDYPLKNSWASLVTQMITNPPAMQETWI